MGATCRGTLGRRIISGTLVFMAGYFPAAGNPPGRGMPIRGRFGSRLAIFPGFLCLIRVFVCPRPGTERISGPDG